MRPAAPPRRSVPPPPCITDRIANLRLDNRPSPPLPPPRKQVQHSRGPPPPIPSSTRPTQHQLAKALARRPPPPPTKHQPAQATVPPPLPSRRCIECYDFSAVDYHASLFPRHTVSSLDDLAHALTSPFPTQTEKARAIFTWLHHNIAYDAASFLSGNLPAQDPSSTLVSGLAVCDGYAGLFLYIAERAGLQAYKVTGHGKGYGYQPLAPGQRAPAFSSNHAWNTVLMDDEWRLIDACWGAGYLNGSIYTKSFTPRFFTSSPVEFGKHHYPTDPSYQLLSDEQGGPVSWENYILDPEGPHLYADFYAQELSPMFLQPSGKYLNRGQSASFHLFKRCEHVSTADQDNYVYFLHLDNRDFIPLQLNAQGGWSTTIPSVKGNDVKLCVLKTLNNADAKGVGAARFTSSIGRVTMSWGGLATWSVA
ncbi:hypothetical protein AMATHDRAFT_74865 [Amanita thiersii Skay4041]|uniref:Transglutaminase-like domain-containing protein n=1 Tax=Amanita thiersii Skay4041 TaxID=703135 RepID=A0A2A9NUY7_9AGAR|nr:hypothetical protein AMATHDRAFT_74865 [Amanita thiersii Skay4041]